MMNKLGYVFLGLLVTVMVVSGASNDAPLADAAMRGDVDAVRTLLADGADVNVAQGDGSTALHWAAYHGELDLVALLIDRGADVAAATRIGSMTPLAMAARVGNAPIIGALLDAGASAMEANTNGTTVLMTAAASGSAEAVRVLLEKGADVDATDVTNGQTALMFAASLNRASTIEVLIDNGADPDITTNVSEVRSSGRRGRGGSTLPVGGLTALHFAARDGHMDAIRQLVAGGADVNVLSPANQTSPMTEAIINANLDIAKFLLDNGADLNGMNADGLTPLYAVVDIRWRNNTWYPQPDVGEEKTDYLDLMGDLLDRGADVNARLSKRLWYRTFRYGGDWIDPAGATAFWRAAQAHDIVAMRLLSAHGANPTIANTGGVTPLMVVTGYGFDYQSSNILPDSRLAAARYLVEEAGADVHHQDDWSYTPLHGAAYVGDNDLIRYLVAQGGDVRARARGRLSGTRPATEAPNAMGDTVADMANGPREKSLLHPATVALLEALGSENSHDCRSTACVNNTVLDPSGGGR